MPQPRFIKRIDWELLKQQKNQFIGITYSGELAEDQKKSMEGILSLLDAMQDYAVDLMGIDESVVFGSYHQAAINKK